MKKPFYGYLKEISNSITQMKLYTLNKKFVIRYLKIFFLNDLLYKKIYFLFQSLQSNFQHSNMS